MAAGKRCKSLHKGPLLGRGATTTQRLLAGGAIEPPSGLASGSYEGCANTLELGWPPGGKCQDGGIPGTKRRGMGYGGFVASLPGPFVVRARTYRRPGDESGTFAVHGEKKNLPFLSEVPAVGPAVGPTKRGLTA